MDEIKKICIIGGCGHVGIPLGLALSTAGFTLTLVDINKEGRQISGPFLKGLMSRMAGITLHYLAGVATHDATNSFKLYRTSNY